MIISFDLDGTICDSDSTMLAILHDRYRKAPPAEQDGAELLLRHYYMTRKVVLDPRDFQAPGDQIIVVTGRICQAQGWTKDWLARWLPDVAYVFTATERSEQLFAEGHYEEGSRVLALSKLGVLRFTRAAVHFDNNPFIIEELRQQGVTAIQVGRALA